MRFEEMQNWQNQKKVLGKLWVQAQKGHVLPTNSQQHAMSQHTYTAQHLLNSPTFIKLELDLDFNKQF